MITILRHAASSHALRHLVEVPTDLDTWTTAEALRGASILLNEALDRIQNRSDLPFMGYVRVDASCGEDVWVGYDLDQAAPYVLLPVSFFQLDIQVVIKRMASLALSLTTMADALFRHVAMPAINRSGYFYSPMEALSCASS